MKIRDSYATINGDKTEHEMLSGGLDIIAEDGKSLFCIRQIAIGIIEISGGMVCKENGVLLDDKLIVIPRATNLIYIQRQKYGFQDDRGFGAADRRNGS